VSRVADYIMMAMFLALMLCAFSVLGAI